MTSCVVENRTNPPAFAKELGEYLNENQETIDALSALVDDLAFHRSELGQSLLSDGLSYFTSSLQGNEKEQARQWICNQAQGSASFLIGMAAYLEGVKFVVDCLLLKKAS